MHETKRIEPERAMLIGLKTPASTGAAVESSLAELAQLAETAGLQVLDTITHSRARIDPAFFIGRGKAELISHLSSEREVDVVVFDDDLSPGQAKNLENMLQTKVIDRSGLILDIFARRARTREACTQVELAQLEYLLPRLTRQWTHLSRQGVGGVGLRGPGETQLEVDRRLVRKRIAHLSKQLEKIERQRSLRRRHRDQIHKIALVGYTNAGKSTLMNALTDSEVFVEDRLFATLDPTIRALELPRNGDGKPVEKVVLIDTVGFIRKLPHHLIASFKSTLEETREASLLLHVIDLTHPHFEQQIETVKDVLRDLGLGELPTIHVFNKVDALSSTAMVARLKEQYAPAVFVSAARHMFLEELRQRIHDFVYAGVITIEVDLPLAEQALLAHLYQLSQVVDKRFDDEGVHLRLNVSPEAAAKIDHLLANHSLKKLVTVHRPDAEKHALA